MLIVRSGQIPVLTGFGRLKTLPLKLQVNFSIAFRRGSYEGDFKLVILGELFVENTVIGTRRALNEIFAPMPALLQANREASYRTPDPISGQSFCVWKCPRDGCRRPACGLGLTRSVTAPFLCAALFSIS